MSNDKEGISCEEDRKQGRPVKYKPEFNDLVYKLALLGLTDEALATALQIATSTLNRWKYDYSGFWESIQKGRVIADAKVAESLYKRANGFEIKEVKVEVDELGGAVKQIEITKQIPPDTQAASLWLRNRQPKEWRDRQEVVSKNVNYDLSDKDPKEASQKYQEIMGD